VQAMKLDLFIFHNKEQQRKISKISYPRVESSHKASNWASPSGPIVDKSVNAVLLIFECKEEFKMKKRMWN
jgi:hypothetical protein